ncbi:hypothetical protein [Conexibacter woesei]|uniref:Uncharacterized protein n=1 Tax=Conexibacter woesei (strain DSM 14684 / CCUG 47730 / CIP 108061 / JCM 11494 / NBRC 100937 / ID131577) TaxID=469383 RepID=D3F841_CONWI|nr:hypothetical protein [Conexibacter woesei]ADB52935.1 hypothetical protein Cwoe_4522 [Conexibacter woesei DSM 14684]
MRFAVSRFSKAIVIGVLGCAAAVLVACGDRNGLLPGDQASSLSSALDGVAAACSRGQVDAALDAAGQFQQRVDGLSARTVDRQLIRNLRQGASTLEQLVSDTCTEVQETIPTETIPKPSPETTPTPSTTPTTPTTPQTTPPDTGGGTTTPPDTTGGGTTTPPDTGGDGGTTPDTGGGATDDQQVQPDVNEGNPGGALAPGQGGSTP